jgi:hypothetical protein
MPADAVDLLDRGQEIVDMFERMGSKKQVDRIVAKRQRTIQVGDDIDASQRRAVHTDEALAPLVAAAEVNSAHESHTSFRIL